MGANQSGAAGEKKEEKKEKKRFEAAPPPTRVGKKTRKRGDAASRLPPVTPTSKCKLRLLKLERVKDYLLMEEEFVTAQERLKPQEARNEEDRTKVDDLRGSPMSVGNLEEIIDDKRVAGWRPRARRERSRHPPSHAIVSSSVGPEYYVSIMSFVDKSQARKGARAGRARGPLTHPPLRSWSRAARCCCTTRCSPSSASSATRWTRSCL